MKLLAWALAVLGLLSGIVWTIIHEGCLDCMLLRHRHRRGERNAAGSLMTLRAAQADYRSNDRDGNRIQDYWRGDVAGLYGLIPAGTTDRIKLIELSVAGADARPGTDVDTYTVRAKKAGYWYRAIRHVDEDPSKPDPDRYAFCAFPDSPSDGKWMYVLDQRGTIYQALGVKGGVAVFPDAAGLKAGWKAVP